MNLRDRDYIVGLNGLIFRVLGYFHPPDGYVCDLEYVPLSLYCSNNPRAPRGCGTTSYYKLYGDEPFKLVNELFPEYRVYYKPLSRFLPGVPISLIGEVKLPIDGLMKLIDSPKDKLSTALENVLNIVLDSSKLNLEDFGVFGSLLFGFYNPNFSDLDLIIYGSENLEELRDCLSMLYRENLLHNEFEGCSEDLSLKWKFGNYPYKLFLTHQKRKLIYAIYKPSCSRPIKVEFEPVKSHREIVNEYINLRSIVRLGWFKASAIILNDSEAAFMPSTYEVEVENIMEGFKVDNVKRIVSYVEEYRLQAFKDERVYVEGWLEKVETSNEAFYQIALTYGPRYYEQTLYSLDLLQSLHF
ncbi:nucleotidyltransferase domain-containing protein [Candidatus Bathyarchaeota archaeon]|nr:nucleotidyltransferase domain-containing protein [Candidatus Bathyarchaeota archaeon]